ncbi:MAG TPA: hypothetical protein VNH65_14245 [Candidatus Acidoferrum sp.]|nr:hypothetical protein [Candidatus Acidoferrum sp.]
MAEYTVVSADLEKDRQVIIDLWRQNLADISHLEEKYDWHFLNNPFGPGQIWILKADGHPIGTTSLGMRPLKLGESITNAGVACDLAVNKEHRFLQPALMLQRALLSTSHSCVRFVYGVPNFGGASVMKYVGYRESCRVHRYAKVLRISHYLRRFGNFGADVSLIGRMADQGFAALHSFGLQEDDRVAQPLPCFDERFDELWSRVSSEHSALTVRNRRFLKWRYYDCPLRQYQTLALLTEDKSMLLGYLIYYVENHSAVCADLLTLSGPEDLGCLLSSWTAAAWRDGLASLSLSCSDGPLPPNLLSHGFTRRSSGPTTKPVRSNRHEQCKTLFTHEQHSVSEPALTDCWYYTEGDSPY